MQVTAIGCLYFLDPTNIANDKGLAAVGVILLVMNMGYVAVMLVLIAMYGAAKTKHFTRQAFAVLKSSSIKLKQSVSGLSSSGSFGERSRAISRSSDSQTMVSGEKQIVL